MPSPMRLPAVFSLLCLAILLALTGCGGCGGDDDDNNDSGDDDDTGNDDANDDVDDDADDDVDPEVFRIAVITDLNIMADDLIEGNIKIRNAVETLNARDDFDFTVILGDVASRFYYWWWDDSNPDYDPTLTWEDSVAEALAILGELDKPFFIVPGEKDYMDWIELDLGFEIRWADRDERTAQLHALYGDAFPGTGAWYTLDHKGVRFFAANSVAGQLWQDGNGVTGSLGAEQLDDLASEASGASPTILLVHHNPVAILEPSGETTLEDVLSSKAGNTFAMFNGHHWSYVDFDFAGVAGIGFDAIFENEDFYAIVEVDPSAPSAVVVNRDDLPFRPEYENFSCTPGESTADMTGLVDTFHTLFIEQMDTDYWVLDMLLASADLGHSPFALWVYEDNGDGTYEIELTQGDILNQEYHPYECNYCVYGWMNIVAPCEMYTWEYDEPCMSTMNASIQYNVMKLIDQFGDHAFCDVDLIYESDFTFRAKMGEDVDGNTTFESGEIGLTLEKDKVLDALERLIVDSYCAYNCESDGNPVDLMFPADQCDAATNGDAAACDGGTLTFDDVPAACDTLLGDNYAIPARLVMSMIDLLPETMTVDFRFRGWGHEMRIVSDWNDLDQDYSMFWGTWTSECTVQPMPPF